MAQLDEWVEAEKVHRSNTQLQDSLKAEIVELQDKLQNQFAVRREFERAMSCRIFSHDIMNDSSIPSAAKELIKDIAVLELEVVYLEQYLLSLYRKTFDQKMSSQSSVDERSRRNLSTHKEPFPDFISQDSLKQEGNIVNQASQPKKFDENLFDSGINRCYSSLSQYSAATSSPLRSIANAVDSYHSLPLSMLEQSRKDDSNCISLAEHLNTSINNRVMENPNLVSEEMIKCISAIYCELADPPLINHNYPSSPDSFSSVSEFQTQGQPELWSPQHGNFSSFNSSRYNPFHIGGSREFSGPYCSMVKVEGICRDGPKLRDTQHMLKHFRSLVSNLEAVDLGKLRHEEKLAFWINVHNSLVMHAYLVFGIPQNSTKRTSLILKAAYNIGGQTVNVDTIQSSILRCRLFRPGQWLRMLFPSKTRLKFGDSRNAYSIEHPEPRLYFALCTGNHSDPAVRVYTPKRVFEDLEAAKEEYIQSTLTVYKERKIHLPRLVELFVKESGLCLAGLMEMIEHLLPSSMRNNILQQSRKGKFSKSVEWIPHNFSFRYLISKELA